MKQRAVYLFGLLKGGAGKSMLPAIISDTAASGKGVLVIDTDLNNSCSFSYPKSAKKKNNRRVTGNLSQKGIRQGS
jgi:cellulose biosynthesis protein BcsQ